MSLKEIGILIGEFEQIDRKLLDRYYLNEFLDNCSKVRQLKVMIKELIAQQSSLMATGPLAIKIRNIRENRGYNIDKLTDFLNRSSQDNVVSEEDPNYKDPLSDSPMDWLTGLYDGRSKVEDLPEYQPQRIRRRQAGAIVCNQSLPVRLIYLFDKTKECYIFGLNDATVVFCRALIEVGIFEYETRRGIIRDQHNVVDISKYCLKDLRDKLPREIKISNIYKSAYDVIIRANRILHTRTASDDMKIDEKEALNCIIATIQFLEYLFR